MFTDDAPGSVVLSPEPMSNDSVSVGVLFALCCPLPPAVDDADVTDNLLFGFGSGSTGLSLKSCAAVVSSLFFFPLLPSPAPPQRKPSLLRSNLSAPCGVTLKHSLIRTLPRSVVFECHATGASNSGPELVDVLLGDSFPLNSCSFKWQWRDWDLGPLELPVCPLSICRLSLSRGTPIYVLDGFFVHLL